MNVSPDAAVTLDDALSSTPTERITKKISNLAEPIGEVDKRELVIVRRANYNEAYNYYSSGDVFSALDKSLTLINTLNDNEPDPESSDVVKAVHYLLLADSYGLLTRIYDKGNNDKTIADEAISKIYADEAISIALSLYERWFNTVPQPSRQNFTEYGIALYRTGQISAAIDRLSMAVKLDTSDPEGYLYFGAACRAISDPNAAKYLKRATILAPTDWRAYYELAELYESAEDHEEASLYYEIAGKCLNAQRRYEEAYRVYGKALMLNESSVNAAQGYAASLVGLRRYDEAMMLLNTKPASQILPDVSWHLIAVIQFERGRPSEALAALDKIDSGLSGDPDRLQLRGLILNRLCKYDEALGYLDAALKLNSRDLITRAAQSVALFELGRTEEAAVIADEVIKHNSNNIDAMLVLARNALKTGGIEHAVQILSRIIELDPEHAIALSWLSRTSRQAGDVQNAVIFAERAAAIDPVNENVLVTFIEALISSDQLEEANTYLRKLTRSSKKVGDNEFAVDNDNRCSSLNCRIGVCLKQIGDIDQAIYYLNMACEANPQNTVALFERAELLYTSEKYTEALRDFDAGVMAEPTPTAYARYSQVLYERQEYKEALKNINLAIDPDSIFPEYIRRKALILLALERHEEAKENFEMITYTDPAKVNADIALLEHRRDETVSALEYIDKALSFDQDSGWARAVKAEILADIAEYTQSIALIESVFKKQDKKSAELLVLLGWSYLNIPGKARKALDAYQEADQLAPGNLMIKKGIADAHYVSNKIPEITKAHTLYIEIIEGAKQTIDGEKLGTEGLYSDMYWLLGWCYHRTKDYDRAVLHFTRAAGYGRNSVAVQFDLVLAFLCSGQVALAEYEFNRGIKMAADVNPLRRRGILDVAKIDLDDSLQAKQIEKKEIYNMFVETMKKEIAQASKEGQKYSSLITIAI